MLLTERPWTVSRRLILYLLSLGLILFSFRPGLGLRKSEARVGFNHPEETSPDGRAAPGGWDREGAARYLDERMEVWFAKAKKLKTQNFEHVETQDLASLHRTGQAETSCVSCHTTVPYVLARPALRRAMQVSAATPEEMRLLEETTRRVENPDAHQPLYDHNERKKIESRGTEAVLNALILASADAAQNRRAPSAATQQALKRLWETQRTDGAWDWLDFGLEPFETVEGTYYGATLAALAVGIAPGASSSQAAERKAGVEKLRGYLKEKYASQSLFNQTWLLLASTQMEGLLIKAQREALVTELQGRQREDGGWSLQALGPWRWSKPAVPFQPPGKLDAQLLAQSDGYGTGLVVYTLRQAGLPISHPAVSRGLQWLRANQQRAEADQPVWPVWRAHSLNFDREHGGEKGEAWRRMFMSDSATAFAVLALVASD